ncbi:MAG: hypothetical protein SNJ57_16280 [Cyanobacteriota bacterium]
MALKSALSWEQRTDYDNPELWQPMIDECDFALNLWDEEVEAAIDRVIAQLRERGLHQFADALASGDYSILSY